MWRTWRLKPWHLRGLRQRSRQVRKKRARSFLVPNWVWLGGALLAFIAGSVNSVAVLQFHHQAVSHVTGSVTLLGIAAIEKNTALLWQMSLMIASFFLGATLSGTIIRDDTLRFGRRYGVALAVESVLLAMALYFLRQNMLVGDYLASVACGLQNAMATTYSGAIVRTTHMTGILTDLGISLGHALRGLGIDSARLRLHLGLFVGFVSGSAAGGIGYGLVGVDIMLMPVVICGTIGVSYFIWRHLVPPAPP